MAGTNDNGGAKGISYEALKLGEKARDAFLAGKPLSWIKENCAVYLNTNTEGGIGGLNTTDLVIAGVLAGMPVLIGGQYGSGKSQLASDISRHYFGGPKLAGGESANIDVNPDTEILAPVNEIYTRYTGEERGGIKIPKVELSPNIKALLHWIDEINRTPTIKQNQFYPLLNGKIRIEGKDYDIGHDGFRAVIATANLGNGLYQGTFDFDPALKNRFGLVIDTNYAMFEPTEEDRGLISMLREADPGIKSAPIRDISAKILEAHKEITKGSVNLSLPEKAVLWFLREGLRTCLKKGEKGTKEGESWFEECRNCPHKTDTDIPSCYYTGSPVPRTLEATALYASALAFLSKVKEPKAQIDSTDLMFKAFELSAAYQPFVNPDALRDSKGGFSRFMANAVSKLKDDFNKDKDYILTALESAERGKNIKFYKAKLSIPAAEIQAGQVRVVESEGEKIPNESDEFKKYFETLNPFDDKSRKISLSWVNGRADLIRKLVKSRKLNETEGTNPAK